MQCICSIFYSYKHFLQTCLNLRLMEKSGCMYTVIPDERAYSSLTSNLTISVDRNTLSVDAANHWIGIDPVWN